MSNTGTPPVIPAEFRQYNSYEEDPKYQTKLTIIWTSVFAAYALHYVYRLAKEARVRGRSAFGLSAKGDGYDVVPKQGELKSKRKGVLYMTWSMARAVLYWTVPGIGLDFGQLLLISAYFAAVITNMTVNAPLMSNSNRPGFIAVSLLPPLYLLSALPISLNFLHRWTGRLMLLSALLHGALWIRNHLQYGLPILGQQKETSGVAALAVLGLVGLSSVRIVRRKMWEGFWFLHVLLTTAFFITLCYHTIYARPWIYPPLAFFGFSLVVRILRVKFADAVLVKVDQQMTLIHVPYIPSTLPGQHINLTVFHPSRYIFESHPVSVITAAPHISCITSHSGGMTLGVRAVGGWSRAVNSWAGEGASLSLSPVHSMDEKGKGKGKGKEEEQLATPVHVLLSPAPGSSAKIDIGEFESVLLVAGGSGATWCISLLDDIVGRIVRRGREGGERTRRIEVVWCVKSFGSIHWFAPLLADIAHAALSCTTLSVHITVYVTCLCNPEAVPPIPNCDVLAVPRPDLYKLVLDMCIPPSSSPSATKETAHAKEHANCDLEEDAASIDSAEEEALGLPSSKLPWVGYGGGLALCACGPESMVREARNAGARVGMGAVGRRIGGVEVCVEGYEI
ncbi:hypothetical protein BDQ17DRAFT_1376326 [Cyathus striatus]|nr:hypothetical protein BDQ17DRAFT_1376326 [Cyathus striatus]